MPVTHPYVVSREHHHAVTECPKCHSKNLRGPFDTKRSAGFLFMRAWCCLDCWWDREMQFFDDVADAADKQARRDKKNKEARARRLGASA